MNVIDELGLEEARARCNAAIAGDGHGFQRAKDVYVCDLRRGHYEHRVLIAVAYALQFPDRQRLHPRDFHAIDYKAFFRRINQGGYSAFGFMPIEVALAMDV